MKGYTVNNIPLWLRPFIFLYGWLGGIFFYLLNAFFRLFCRIEYIGKEHIVNTPNHIFSIWHENVVLFFIVHRRFYKPNIFLSFPAWFMKPIHVMKKIIRVREIAYGASGHDGRAALSKVVHRLKEGWSTFLTPDGPYGPLKVIKDGVLMMSLESSTPIIPVAFHLSRDFRIPSWDRKRYPVPFCKITVVYGAPVSVTEADFDAVRDVLATHMNDPQEVVAGTNIAPEL
ncbi:MAG: hypothetical protein KJP00_01685 [Bacteroidia bacterium]|nr:hypothetical protein [Bacteroidia bacterium]